MRISVDKRLNIKKTCFKEIAVRLLFMLKKYGILKNMLCQILIYTEKKFFYSLVDEGNMKKVISQFFLQIVFNIV